MSALPLLHPPTLMPSRAAELARAIDGFARTHVPLVAYDGGVLRAAGRTDDSGLFFYGSLVARLFGTDGAAAATILLGSILVVAVAVALVQLPRMFATLQGRLVGAAAIVLSALVAWWVGDVYIASVAAVLAVVPAAVNLPARVPARAFPVLLAAGLFLGFADTIRSQTSLPVVAVVVPLVVVWCSGWTRRARALAIVLLLLGTAIPHVGYRMAQLRRDAWLEQRVPGYKAPIGAHPFWHTAYIGFGFLANEHGIVYRDEWAAARVHQLDPAAPFVSARYEAVLRGEVARLVREDPVFVLETEAAKAGVLALFLLVFMNVGLIALLRRREPARRHVPWWAGLALGAAPGFVAVPHLPYVLGFMALAALYGSLCVDVAFGGRLGAPERRSPADAAEVAGA